MSKIIEKAMLLRFNKHCQDYNLLPNNQSAYRPIFLCETTLLRLTNDILVVMETKQITSLLAIDLSAAFDTGDHSLLLNILETALNWVSSYLRPHSFKIKVGNDFSSPRLLEFCVSQGSCSGPILFLAYISTLCDVIPPEIDLSGFADDHILKTEFSPKSVDAEPGAISTLENVTVKVKDWMDSNKLKMNCSKTEFILFGSRQQINKCSTTSINRDRVDRAGSIKYLGAMLDENLNFKNHANTKCKTAMMNFHKISLLRPYLTVQVTKVFVLSLVMSHLDYSNSILYGIASNELNKMQIIQNICAKLVLKRKSMRVHFWP